MVRLIVPPKSHPIAFREVARRACARRQEALVPLPRMHEDELDIDAGLVRRLLVSQFPQWADLALVRVPSAGTDNALFRLGSDMVVRLPRIHWAVRAVEKEQRWLPWLASQLPLAIPTPMGSGAPGEGYPWPWSVYRWLEGDNAIDAPFSDQDQEVQAAHDLAGFLRVLQHLDTTDGPLAGTSDGNISRGVPLASRDESTREAIARLDGRLDVSAAQALWDAALHAPEWSEPPVWVHGDLSPLNLLVQQGRISAVIDFGTLAVGDPAVDLLIAWNSFSAQARAIFGEDLGVDDATWMRGLGWALNTGVGFPYYEFTNPVLAGIARRGLDEALAEWQRCG